MNAPPQLDGIATAAVEMIPDQAVVGLGTGHAASAFIRALAERVQQGLRIRGVPTSEQSARLARELAIPLATLEEIDAIDVDVDGADEVDPECNLIKGFGGALVREKVVAFVSRRLVILVGKEKVVPVLGTRGKLPVEVVHFALPVCRRKLAAAGLNPELRIRDGQTFVTDNGNVILDCHVGTLDQPAELESFLKSIPGVVGTGLFLAMADDVLIQHDGQVEHRRRPGSPGNSP